MDKKLPAQSWVVKTVLHPQTHKAEGLLPQTLPLMYVLHMHGRGLEGAITSIRSSERKGNGLENRHFREEFKEMSESGSSLPTASKTIQVTGDTILVRLSLFLSPKSTLIQSV